jgi:terminase, large subunit
MTDSSDKSPLNTLSYKKFLGCSTHYKGAHSPNNFRRDSYDTLFIDELDGCRADVGGEGSITTLSWGRVKNAMYKKQIQISTSTLAGFSLIEASAAQAQDTLFYQAQCPECLDFAPLEWGGRDVPYGMKWEGRDPESVYHVCSICGVGWQNDKLMTALKPGFWKGEKGWATTDGLVWTLNGEPHDPPRHIAARMWSAYSPFSAWSQIVEEWYDAQGDIQKLQTFTNTTLGQTWKIEHKGSLTAELIEGLLPTDDLSAVVLVTAGIDVQDDRLEIQYVGHDITGGMIVLGYQIYIGDLTDAAVYRDMAGDVMYARFQCGSRVMQVVVACIDTQGSHTSMVHRFLVGNKDSVRRGQTEFVGINGTANATYEMSNKPGTYKGVKGSKYYSIGVNVLKQKVFSAIRNFDKDRMAYRIWSGALLPEDYGKQLTAEKMEVRRTDGKDRITFTNEKRARNEALDTLVYALAGKSYVKQHRGLAGRRMFPED